MFPKEFQSFDFPDEKKATCHNCPKIASSGFLPDVRCCTYHPTVPNFLLGFSLQDSSTASRVMLAIKAGSTLPQGVVPSPSEQLATLKQSFDNKFGKSRDLLCKFVERETGLCGIYAYRNAICSTFFCHFENEVNGRAFWEALQNLAVHLETALSQWAMEQAGYDPYDYFEKLDELAEQMSEMDEHETWPPSVLKTIWGEFYNHQDSFYTDCASAIWRQRGDLFEIAREVRILDAKLFGKTLQETFDARTKEGSASKIVVLDQPDTVEDLWSQLLRSQQRLKRS